MKILLLTLLSLVPFSLTYGETIDLNYDDQLRLADLLAKLPSNARWSKQETVDSPKSGVRMNYLFPKQDEAFKISCQNDYFNGSPYPSFVHCELSVDEHHPDLEMNYDQYRIMLDNRQQVSALYDAIPYGNPEKEFRSWGKQTGTDFSGKSGNILRYFFKCSMESCRILISKLKNEGFLSEAF